MFPLECDKSEHADTPSRIIKEILDPVTGDVLMTVSDPSFQSVRGVTILQNGEDKR